jgi:hypothetical protein
MCLGLVTFYSLFSIEVQMFFKWLPGHTSGWSAAVMVFCGRDRFENILLMNNRFHRVTKYVKRFSVFAYSRMFFWLGADVGTAFDVLLVYMAIHQELNSQKCTTQTHSRDCASLRTKADRCRWIATRNFTPRYSVEHLPASYGIYSRLS